MLKKKIYAVAHPETGEMLTEKTTKDGDLLLTLRVDQESASFIDGFLNDKPRVLFLSGPPEKMKKHFGHIKDGQDMSEWIQHIAYRESNTPFYPDQKPLVNPKDGREVSANGQNVYREYFAAPEGTQDQRLVRDVVENNINNITAQSIIDAARGNE